MADCGLNILNRDCLSPEEEMEARRMAIIASKAEAKALERRQNKQQQKQNKILYSNTKHNTISNNKFNDRNNHLSGNKSDQRQCLAKTKTCLGLAVFGGKASILRYVCPYSTPKCPRRHSTS